MDFSKGLCVFRSIYAYFNEWNRKTTAYFSAVVFLIFMNDRMGRLGS